MNPIWNENARFEFLEALRYYAGIDRDLGQRFLAAVHTAVAGLNRELLRFRKLGENARKARVERFPYAVICRHSEKGLHIVAVMHLHREPGYWQNRLE